MFIRLYPLRKSCDIVYLSAKDQHLNEEFFFQGISNLSNLSSLSIRDTILLPAYYQYLTKFLFEKF